MLIGIEQYRSPKLIRQILEASKVEVLTLTFDLEGSHSSLLLSNLANEISVQDYILIGTTSFARTAEEAITVARMLKQSLGIRIIKLDVRKKYIIPDNSRVVEVAKVLISEGFYVLPMIIPDQIVLHELEKIGCSAIRLLGSSIGTGQGIVSIDIIQSIVKLSTVPVIIEGGLRSASDVTLAMELGAAAVLVNTALAKARDPVMMALAMREAVEAGRRAYLAGYMVKA